MTALTQSVGSLALVGSGEYLPIMHDIEMQLLAEGQARRGTRRFVQLATAAAPEGDASMRYWHELGAKAAQRLDAEQIIVDVRTREDADNPALAELIDGAALIYLSGGNPVFLVNTIVGSRVGNALIQQWQQGSSLAGCSAGAMAMGNHVVDLRHIRSAGAPGLGLAHVRVLPHFDRWGSRLPNMFLKPFVRPDVMLLGIDEDTAVVYRENKWLVHGRQSAWDVLGTSRQEYPPGSVVPLNKPFGLAEK